MSIVLAIDTSTNRTSVAIVDGEKVLVSEFHDDPLAHGEVLPQLVARALAVESKIDLVAVGMGPGPFTGLRVGIVFAQSFALARGIEWKGAASLDVIAAAISQPEFIATIDARRKEVFWAKYVAGARVGDVGVISPLSLPTDIPIHNNLNPDPVLLAKLALTSENVTEPIYVRRPDAHPAPKGITFRLMTAMDLVTVHALEKASYTEDPWSLAQFKEELAGKDRMYLVAEKDKKVIGFAGVIHRGDTCDVLTLTVDSALRRQGIGREMLRRLIDWSRNKKVPAMMLEVRAGNDEATPLYTSFGFVAISKRPNYYGPGVTAIVMRKELTK
jgi:tRNA threonylcarbamoyl adenosine modification protein YeaZ/ribosomal-protein-alanine acetyltransferase